jgi:hypothetical protein
MSLNKENNAAVLSGIWNSLCESPRLRGGVSFSQKTCAQQAGLQDLPISVSNKEGTDVD